MGEYDDDPSEFNAGSVVKLISDVPKALAALTPIGFIKTSLGVARSMRDAENEPPSLYPWASISLDAPGDGLEMSKACAAQPLVEFLWRHPDGSLHRARRPRDPWDPRGVCVYTDPKGAVDAGLIDILSNDRAATFWNVPHVLLQRLAAAEIPTDTSKDRPGVYNAGGMFGRFDDAELRRQLLERQGQVVGRSGDELYLEALGFAAAGLGADLQTYQYRSTDGSLRSVPIGTFDLGRELRALAACEGPAGGGVGTAATINCLDQLIKAAGGVSILSRSEAVFGSRGVLLPAAGIAETSPVYGAPQYTSPQVALKPAPFTLALASGAPAGGSNMSIFGGDTGFSDAASSIFGGADYGYGFSQPAPATTGGDSVVGGDAGGQTEGFLGGLLGAVKGALGAITSPTGINLLQGLAQAGVVRGSLGQALAPQQQAPVYGAPPTPGGGLQGMTLQDLYNAIQNPMGAVSPALVNGGLQALGIQATSGPIYGPSPYGAVNPATGLPMVGLPQNGNGGLFRARPAGYYLPSRIQVVGPDGQLYVLANLGRATRGSRERSVAKSLAKHEGFKLVRYGAGGGRRGRRRPR